MDASTTAVADADDAAADALADAADNSDDLKEFVASEPSSDEPVVAQPIFCGVCGRIHPVPACELTQFEIHMLRCNACRGRT